MILTASGCNPPAGGGGGAEPAGFASADEQRATFQSQCAQNVINCTTSWPTPIAGVVSARRGQTVEQVDDNRFLVRATDRNMSEEIQLVGSNSMLGDGATTLSYSWTIGAMDDDPNSLTPGTEFSTEADPLVTLQAGFHYIRLTVTNDNRRDFVAPDGEVLQEDALAFDFVEIEVEVDDN
jgi:hypothetical protein